MLEPSSEKEIENSILTWLNFQQGIFAFKVNTMGVYDFKKQTYRKTSKFVLPGTSDIIGSAFGKIIAFEVKTSDALIRFLNNPTPHDMNQRAFLQKIMQTGGIAGVVCSLDQVIALIQNPKAKQDFLQAPFSNSQRSKK
jgi:penicillin-binding protein-related factor A (putative recombinase)